MALYVQNLSEQEVKQIEALICEPEDDLPVNRLLIILLPRKAKAFPKSVKRLICIPLMSVSGFIAIRQMVWMVCAAGNHRDAHRFHIQTTAADFKDRRSKAPQLGLIFSRWSLQRLRRYLIEQGVVDRISIETIRQIIQSNDLVAELN